MTPEKMLYEIECNIFGERNVLRKNTVISNVFCSLFSPAFGLAVIGTVVSVFLGAGVSLLSAFQSEDMLGAGFYRDIVVEGIRSDLFLFMLPILCVIPYAASYLEDRRSGFVKIYLIRTSRRGYLTGKALACMLSGGFCLVLGIGLALIFSKMAFQPMELPSETAFSEKDGWDTLINTLSRMCLSGAFWSFVGMDLSAITSSKYMAYGGSFILYYVLIILCERYFPGCYVLYPKEWIYPERIPFGGFGVFVVCFELWALLFFLFMVRENGRLEKL